MRMVTWERDPGIHSPGDSHDRPGLPVVPWFLHAALFFLLICINALVAKFVVFSFAFAPGASLFYIVVALMIAFTLWFGMYGALAAYVGCYIGAGLLSGIPPDVALYWSLADFWQVIIPLAAFRVWGCNPALRSWRDAGILLVFGVVVNNIIGATWGSVTLALGGLIPWSSVGDAWVTWFLGNFIVCILLLPLFLRSVTPWVQGHDLYIRGWWQ